jgi:hypothetical protein
MCFNPSPVRRVPSPNRYMAVARFCFCKNNKRTIDRPTLSAQASSSVLIPFACTYEFGLHPCILQPRTPTLL